MSQIGNALPSSPGVQLLFKISYNNNSFWEIILIMLHCLLKSTSQVVYLKFPNLINWLVIYYKKVKGKEEFEKSLKS